MMDRVDLDLNNYNLKQEVLEREWADDCENKRAQVLDFTKNIINGETSIRFDMIFVDWINKSGLDDADEIRSIKNIIWLCKYGDKNSIKKKESEHKKCFDLILNFSCKWLFKVDIEDICDRGDGYSQAAFINEIWNNYFS